MRKMTETNLQAAFSGESQAHMRYLIFADKAEKDGHARRYGEAKATVEAGADVQIGEIHICEVCGWTGDGEKPDKCPICGAKAERIRAF